MVGNYSNNTKHKDAELGVSRGQVDYIHTQFLNSALYFQYNKNPEDVSPDISTGVTLPPKNIHPRGRYVGGNQLGEFSSTDTATSIGLALGDMPTANVFSTKIYEGQNDNAGQSVFSSFSELDPYIKTHRIPYSSKIIPIFAQGTETAAPYTGNFSYSFLELLNLNLPYVKANILWGEISNIVPAINAQGDTAAQLLSGFFGKDQYIQYPLYNAIEVIFNSKSLLGTGSGTRFPSGGAWFKKTFLISWALKEFTEVPFPTIDNSFTIQRKYWYPTGLLPGEGFVANLNFEKYGVYTHDATVPPSDINGNEYGNVFSNWIRDYSDVTPFNFTNDENLLKITLNDSEKTSNIKISVATRREGQINHNKFMIKGIAKLI